MKEAREVELMHIGSAKIISYMSKEQRAAFDDIFSENYDLYYLEVEKKNKDFALGDCGYVSLAMFFKTIPQEEKTALLEKFKYEELKGNGNR